jgi:hypothetical protein
LFLFSREIRENTEIYDPKSRRFQDFSLINQGDPAKIREIDMSESINVMLVVCHLLLTRLVTTGISRYKTGLSESSYISNLSF